MRRFATIGVCLAVVAVFAVVAVASAAAAEPAIYECHKEARGHGKYEKRCKVAKEGGGYEIKEGFGKGKPFKGKGDGANLNITNFGGISCTSSSDSGKFTSPTTAGDVVVTFKGCAYNGKTCESGTTAGEIVTDPLEGKVGYISGKGTKSPIVGAVITAETDGTQRVPLRRTRIRSRGCGYRSGDAGQHVHQDRDLHLRTGLRAYRRTEV